ncbi:MAG TPA: AAA family ATPase [Terriglobales bacterium]|nr:AAA family ATPase [Terriglobales bacterium]
MRYHFAQFEVDVAGRQLRHAGLEVPVQPKVLDLLVYLIERRDRVVAKSELLQALWPDTTVVPAVLTSSINRLRQAIGGSALRTMHRQGYRFMAEVEVAGDRRPAPAQKTLVRSVAASELRRPSFVGRTAELSRLRAVLARANATLPETSLVLITGEPGIGKTRTAQELAELAAAGGCVVAWGRCYEAEGGRSFGPWVQLLEEIAAKVDVTAIQAQLPLSAPELIALVPGLRSWMSESRSERPARTALEDDLVALLSAIASRQPLVVIFDDLQWADSDSLRLLQLALRQLRSIPLLAVATCRAHEPSASRLLDDIVYELERDGRAHRIDLERLHADDLAAVVRGLSEQSIDAELTDSIAASSEGNPFFAAEFWRHIGEQNWIRLEGGRWVRTAGAEIAGLPRTIDAMLKRRISRLSPPCRALLDAAAIVGRELFFDIAGRVADLAPEAALDALDEAIAARILEEAEAPGKVRFVHALQRESLHGDLGRTRRAQLHVRALDILECDGGESSSAERAHHAIQGLPLIPSQRAVALAVCAGEDSVRLLAYGEAAAHFDQAVSLAERLPVHDQVAELLLRQGEVLQLSGEGERARTVFERAAERARRSGSMPQLARAALGMTTLWSYEDPVAIALLEEVVASRALDPELHTRALGKLAAALYPIQDARERRDELCRRALDAARASRNSELLVDTLISCIEAQWYSDNPHATLAMTEELLAEAGEAQRAARATARAWRTVLFMSLGRIDAAHGEVEHLTSLAADLRQPTFRWYATHFRAVLSYVHGNMALAERLVEEARLIGHRVSEKAAAFIYNGLLLTMRRDQGRVGEVLPRMSAVEQDGYGTRPWTAPVFLLEMGQVEQAKAMFEHAARNQFRDLPPDNARNTRISSIAAISFTCAALGDRERAAQLYRLALPYQDHWIVMGWGTTCLASMHNALGALAATEARWDAATSHFEAALRSHREQNARPAEARTHLFYARMLRSRGAAGDADRAAAHIDASLELCRSSQLAGIERDLLALTRTEASAPSAIAS